VLGMTLRSLLNRVGVETDGRTIAVAGQPIEGDNRMAWPSKPTGMTWHTDAEGKQFVKVDGLGVFVVLANDPTPSKLNNAKGDPVVWPSVRKLTLGDDLVVYGCADCTYCHRSADSIRPHRNKHRKLNGAASDETAAILRNAIRSLGGGDDREAEKLRSKIDRLTAERDDWKRRALKAERRLSTMRQALNEEPTP
jgi:hypothetical protein